MKNIEILYSNKGLLPWQGGVTVIEGDKVTIQLRKAYEIKSKIFWIYPKEEIIAHEMVHARRSHLNEPCFEEILAYRTSQSWLRRTLGPLFRTSTESIIFLLSFFPLIVNPLYMSPSLLIPLFYCVRLMKYQRIFSKALSLASLEDLETMSDKEIIDLVKAPLRDSTNP